MATSIEDKTPLVAVYNEKPDLRKKEPPLINLQVTNPITYLKRWWSKVMGNEGIDFRFRIKPLTAIVLTFVIATVGFGVGRISLSSSKPYIQYTPPLPTPIPDPWRDTAFTGTLQYSNINKRYYLLTATSEAINLEVPQNIDLNKFIGKRIFATGRYNQSTRILVVEETQDLEILPNQIIPIPTTSTTINPSPSPSISETLTDQN